MKPMFAIVEYASMRLMFVCAIAMTLPRIIDSSDSTISMPCQSNSMPPSAPASTRSVSRECGELGRGADQKRDRRGRAVVNVRHPHVIRNDAELERDAGQHEHQAEHAAASGCSPLPTAWPARSCRYRASRSRRRSSTCRRGTGRTPCAPSTKYFIAASAGALASRCSATSAYSRQRHELEPEVERHEVVRRHHAPSCRARRTASARTSRRGTGCG